MGPSEPPEAPNATRISSSVEGRDGWPIAASSLFGSSRSSPRTSTSTTAPSARVTGIAFDVAAGSIPRNPASASIVVASGRLDLLGRVEQFGKLRGGRNAAGDLEIGGEVRTLTRHQRVLARARGSEEVERLAPSHHSRLGLDPYRVDAATLEDPHVGAPVAPRTLRRGRPRHDRTSTSLS